MYGLEFCNDCPFLCIHKKTKKLCCGPYEYIFKKEDIVPKWCPNKKEI